jgi:hypothetical protein
MGRQSSLNDTDHGVIIPIVEITGLNPGAARPGEFDFMAEVREAVLANTMLAALAGDADQRVTERTIVVPATRRAGDEVLPELPDRRIERRVGRVASATVYLGVHLPTGRRERLVCLQGADHHDIFIERYLEEYRKLAQIQQRNVLGIYEIGRHERRAFVATEALDGQTLGEAMRRELPIGLALNCLAQMCMAVDALHNAGIVHGSLQATDFSFRDDRVLVLAELNVNDRVRAALGMDNAGFDRHARTFGDAGGDFRAIGRIFHAMLVGTAQSTLPDSPQASTLELFRATRLPLSLSPVQPCLDRLLGVGSAAPIERAEDVLVELLSLEELFPFDTALGQLEGNPGLRRVGP